MPITTYIVDDETLARERLHYLIEHFLKGEIEIVGQSFNPQEALKQIPKFRLNYYFLMLKCQVCRVSNCQKK